MFPLGLVNQGGTPPVSWNKVLEMKFNNNFTDSTGRHSPVSYGAVISSAQSVEGGYSMYVSRNGRVIIDDYYAYSADFDNGTGDIRVVCDVYPETTATDRIWMKSVAMPWDGGGVFGYNLLIDNLGGGVAQFRLVDNTNSTVFQTSVSGAFSKWTNVDIRRESEIWYMYIDGVLTNSTGYQSETIYTANGSSRGGYTIGGRDVNNQYSGYIDNFVVYTK